MAGPADTSTRTDRARDELLAALETAEAELARCREALEKIKRGTWNNGPPDRAALTAREFAAEALSTLLPGNKGNQGLGSSVADSGGTASPKSESGEGR